MAFRGSDQQFDGDHSIGLVRLCCRTDDLACKSDGVVGVDSCVVVADAQAESGETSGLFSGEDLRF